MPRKKFSATSTNPKSGADPSQSSAATLRPSFLRPGMHTRILTNRLSKLPGTSMRLAQKQSGRR